MGASAGSTSTAASGSLLRRLGASLALGVALLGGAMPAMAQAVEPTAITEAMEQQILGHHNAPGQLVDIATGDPAKGTTITIHGTNGSPSTIQPINRRVASQGGQVKTFVYDDRYRELENTSHDLAEAIGSWRAANPGKPLDIHAHSMGTRVVLGALDELQKRGALDDGAAVNLTLLGPPLGGYASANSARWAPGFIDRLIGGVAIGRGMGSSSPFQKMLEGLTLPSNVHTRVVLAETDHLVDAEAPAFKRVMSRLNAEVVKLAGADHSTMIDKLGDAAPPVPASASQSSSSGELPYLAFDGKAP